jgi:Concanavalin A-like lectin/glucanases superfamily
MPILTKIPVASTVPVSVAFVPTTVASCRLWLDASDTATITQDATSNISQWGDKSGNGLNAVSNSVSGWALPTYVSTGAIKYVSMLPSQALHVPGFSYNTAWSVFSCMCNVTLGARWYISPYADLGIVLMGMGHGNNKVFSGMLGGGNDVTGSHIEYTSAQNTNGTGAYTYYRDGTLVDSNNTANGVPSATVRMGIGANGASGYDVDGTYYPFEILIFNQYLGDTDRRNVEGYLAQKWGLTSSLPAGHPGLTQNFLMTSSTPSDKLTLIPSNQTINYGIITGITNLTVTVVSGMLLNLDAASYTSGSTWTALVGNNYTVNGTFTTDSYAVLLNGSSYAQDLTGITSSTMYSFTLDVWFYAAANASGSVIGELGQASLGSWSLTLISINSNTISVGFYSGAQYKLSVGSYTANTWTHVSYTYNDTTKVIIGYVNGVYVSSATVTKLWPTKVYLTTGGAAVPDANFTGRIGAFKVYNSILTADQIKQNYNALAGRYGLGLI